MLVWTAIPSKVLQNANLNIHKLFGFSITLYTFEVINVLIGKRIVRKKKTSRKNNSKYYVFPFFYITNYVGV